MNELNEAIQNDIITCCDGILENEVPSEVLERLKDALCNIIIEKCDAVTFAVI